MYGSSNKEATMIDMIMDGVEVSKRWRTVMGIHKAGSCTALHTAHLALSCPIRCKAFKHRVHWQPEPSPWPLHPPKRRSIRSR